MILPSKHLNPDRALLTVGSEILAVMDNRPSTVSSIWDDVRELRASREETSSLPFDWFILALSLLYAMSAVEITGDSLRRKALS
jgi:hypothetical protein